MRRSVRTINTSIESCTSDGGAECIRIFSTSTKATAFPQRDLAACIVLVRLERDDPHLAGSADLMKCQVKQ